MGATPPRVDRPQPQRLHELIIKVDFLIADAERRIERHQKLGRVIAEGYGRRAHNELERNLLQGLALLYMHPARPSWHEWQQTPAPVGRVLAMPPQSSIRDERNGGSDTAR